MLRRLTAVAVAATCLLAPAAAHASGDTVLKDCSDHGRITKKYSQKEYRDALANIPTDLDEYTDCRDQIKKAQLGLSSGSSSGGGGGTAGGGGSSTGGGGGTAAPVPDTSAGPIRDAYVGANATPQEKTQAQKEVAAAVVGPAPQEVVDDDIRPGALAYSNFSSVSKLPVPLVVLGTLILLIALSVGGYLIRGRVRPGRLRA